MTDKPFFEGAAIDLNIHAITIHTVDILSAVNDGNSLTNVPKAVVCIKIDRTSDLISQTR
jgi:hypothetical protein